MVFAINSSSDSCHVTTGQCVPSADRGDKVKWKEKSVCMYVCIYIYIYISTKKEVEKEWLCKSLSAWLGGIMLGQWTEGSGIETCAPKYLQ